MSMVSYSGGLTVHPPCGVYMSDLPPKPVTPTPYAPPKHDPGAELGPKTSGKAVTALILGLSSFVCFFITGLIGVIVGFLALMDINRSQGRLTGSGMAIAGIVTGLLGSVMTIFVLIAMLLPAVQQVREAARRTDTLNKVRQMAIAMHNHHDSFKRLPYAEGAPEGRGSRLSWRVQILPFLELNHLYDQFNHDEPWDSPHNLALVDQMPEIFRSNNHDLEPGKTVFVVPVTPVDPSTPPGEYQTIFVPGRRTSLESIHDGTSQTIMILEANPEAAVTWTKPEDWEFDPEKPLKNLGEARPTGFCVAFADGSSFFIHDDISPETFIALLTARRGDQAGFY